MTPEERYKLYDDFNLQFPIEGLGKMTLDEFTNLKRSDSFCYWVEFRTRRLGSNKGGSAYKFNIFRYSRRPAPNSKYRFDDKYAWYARLGETADEAFAKTRAMIEHTAHLAREGRFEQIDSIRELGYSVKWKIAFLYSGLKLIPIFNEKYLRIAASEAGMPEADKADSAAMQRYLMDKKGGREFFDYYDSLWLSVVSNPAYESKKISIASKNPSSYPSGKKLFPPILRHMADGRPAVHSDLFRAVGDYFGWTAEDFKIPKKDGTSLLENYVRWAVQLLKDDNLIELAPGAKEGVFTITPAGLAWINSYPASADEADENDDDDIDDAYTDADFLDQVFMGADDFKRLKQLLAGKKNVILQGAPGVGKTFAARRLAYAMMGRRDDSRIAMVQFHQNYSYEDFVMGYRPDADGGFVLREGIFHKFCEEARKQPGEPFFFIIDEINRGNLSKIFGELLMLIERGYRGTELTLAYSDRAFSVPDNVHIIGMMNTADRSLAMIDYALRRRFSFFGMMPGFDTSGFSAEMERHSADRRVGEVVDAVKALNRRIADDESLGEGFCIGHSYFCNQPDATPGPDCWIENVVRFDILPMLEEYWFDDKEKYRAESSRLLELLRQ